MIYFSFLAADCCPKNLAIGREKVLLAAPRLPRTYAYAWMLMLLMAKMRLLLLDNDAVRVIGP